MRAHRAAYRRRFTHAASRGEFPRMSEMSRRLARRCASIGHYHYRQKCVREMRAKLQLCRHEICRLRHIVTALHSIAYASTSQPAQAECHGAFAIAATYVMLHRRP